jgi:hypothetical protein
VCVRYSDHVEAIIALMLPEYFLVRGECEGKLGGHFCGNMGHQLRKLLKARPDIFVALNLDVDKLHESVGLEMCVNTVRPGAETTTRAAPPLSPHPCRRWCRRASRR